MSPTGVADLEFLTPWDGINAEVARLKADDPADVVHRRDPRRRRRNKDLESQIAASPVFKHIVKDIDPAVSALILGHTHQVNRGTRRTPTLPPGRPPLAR